MLIVSLPRLNVSDKPPGSDIGLFSASDGRSTVVNDVWHLGQLRLRQMEGVFLWGRELATLVFLLKQFMQNMSIY